MAFTQAQIDAERKILDAQWRAKDAQRTLELTHNTLAEVAARELKTKATILAKQQADAYKALQKENDLTVANYKNSAIIDQMSAAEAEKQTFLTVKDSIKAEAIEIGAGRAVQARGGFDVNTGTALGISLQQSVEGAFQQANIVKTGGKVSQTLANAANEKLSTASKIKSDFSFLTDSLKPKNTNTNSFTFNTK